MNTKQPHSTIGFTLIELLVVISIIALLASIVVASLNFARVKARDVRRVADLNQIRTAIELFFDANGFYPGIGGSGSCTTYPTWDCNGYNYSYDPNWASQLEVSLRPYISRVPIDPLNGSCAPWSAGCYTYTYGNPGRTTQRVQYDLTAQLEDASNPLRCGARLYTFYFNNQPWCGPYSPQVYEASTN